MLKRIVEISLGFHGVIIALACVLVGYGLFVASHAKLDVFPEFVQPQVTVQAEAPGLAPEQVEALVTRPIESDLNGVGNLESLRSESIQGLSVVTAVFKEGTDVYVARQLLAERMATLSGELPLGVRAPSMSPLTSSTMDLLKFGLVSDKLSPMALRTFADWTVRPRLLSVPGVSKVTVFGGEVRQLQVQAKPDRLIAFGLTIQDVLKAAREATGVRGGGFIETAAQRIVIQSEGQSATPQQLGEVVVSRREGGSVRLKDVANVIDAPEPKFGDALIMGKPGILMTMAGQYGANTLEVTEAVERALEEMRPTLADEGIQYIPRLHRPATFIENAIHNVKLSLLLGIVLVALVLLLFLLDLRTAFISFTAIPLSLLAAVIVLDRFGATINTMTLGGLAVAIGVVVDDAIIDVENILRRLREHLVKQRQIGDASATVPLTPAPLPPSGHLLSLEGGEGRSEGQRSGPEILASRPAGESQEVFQVVLNASLEVRSAVVYASFIVALVFLPVLTMSGLQGRFFAPLGEAFILAIMASLLVALTVTPALCFVMLSRARPRAEPYYLRRLKDLHGRALVRLSRRPVATLSIALALFVGAAATLPFFGAKFLPEFREGHFVLQISAAPGTSLTEMLRLGERISHELLQNPHLKTVEQQIGRAEMGEDTWGPHRSEFHVELNPLPGREEAKVQGEIRAALKKFPGIQSEVLTFLGDRIGETIAGETDQVIVNVFGEDLDVLDQKAAEIARILSSIHGSADVQVKSPPGAPRMAVRLRADRLTQLGFRPVEVLEAIETAFQGAVVAQIYEGNKVFDVAVILEPAGRQEPESLGSLKISNAQGTRMPLRELADVYLSAGRYAILHDGARRRQTVTCNPEGRDLASFVAEAKKQIEANVKFPAGVYPVYSGAAQEEARAQKELYLHSVIAAAGIVLLLAIVFRSGRNLLLVLANLPFALVGGVLAVFATGGSLSLGSLVGFVTLFGITMRNSIMMISHFEHLVQREGMKWNLQAAVRGATERLAPISMTALVTALGLLPLAVGSGETGREIEGPMAIVILGGLITSTLLNLLVLPTLALQYGRFEKLH
jgi:Cu/Ag efflux pump CusA